MKKSQTTFKMYLKTITGAEIERFGGSLKRICEYLGEQLYSRIEGHFQSYHTIRRELLRAGGAYSAYYPQGEGLSPIQLVIIEEQYVVKEYESDEARAERMRPPFEAPAYIQAAMTVQKLSAPTPLEAMIDEVNAETAPAYPADFKTKESCWEGDHTSYVWQKNRAKDVVTGETAHYYVVQWGDNKPRKVKKTSLVFAPFPADLD